MHMKYRPGKEMTLTDISKRLQCTENKDTIDLDVRIDLARFSSERQNDMRNETRPSSQSITRVNYNKMARFNSAATASNTLLFVIQR